MHPGLTYKKKQKKELKSTWDVSQVRKYPSEKQYAKVMKINQILCVQNLNIYTNVQIEI